MPDRAGMVEAVSKALYELSRGEQWPGEIKGVRAYHVGTSVAAEVAIEALSPWLPTPEEAKATIECAWREPDVRWHPDFDLKAYRSGMEKLRRLAGENK